jgi:hypothetical protein
MAINIPLMIILRPLTSAIAKIVLGVTVASITYGFLNNYILPVVHVLEQRILSQVQSLSTVGGVAGEFIMYLDFPHAVSILLATSSACLSIKIMSVAIRAFGINTG